MSALPQHKSWNHKISLISETLSKIGPIYVLFHTQLETLRNYLDKNLKKSFIWETKTIAEFLILFVPKKNKKLRFYVNYRKLNVIIIKNKYLLLNIGELQDRLIGAKWFTKLNLRGAYNLVKIKKDDKWKTVFKIWYRIYKYQIILFELTNTSAIYQILINNTLAGYLDIYAIVYLNNILIYSENLEDHRRHVKNILEWFLAR